MIAHKHISKIIAVFMAAAVVLCFLAIAYSDSLTQALGGTGVRMEYESKLFDTNEIMQVNILMDEDDWNTMLANASSEEYYVCDVVINGETIRNVAIRPKGNTSLSAIAMDPDTDRYSLKLEFDHFVEGQTCFGLDKLILNNNYADATNMKEAIVYDMYQYLGADASLYNYAKVSLNGEYWGVYLALEGVEQSFMLRNYGTQDGELYKPDSMDMGGGNDDKGSSGKPDMGFSPPDTSDFDPSSFDPSSFGASSFDPSSFDASSFDPSSMDASSFEGMSPPSGFDMSSMPEAESSEEKSTEATGLEAEGVESENVESEDQKSGSSRSSRPGGGGGFSGGGGANLNYTDDDLDSYSTIWEGEVTGTGKKDHKRVVKALKNISEGKNLEKYLDIDNVLKYMAVHTFSVNMDSLSGSMAHNYYLYEYKGQLNILPWDYNLSFGGMNAGGGGAPGSQSTDDATQMVNDPIDTPFSGTQFFDALLENEEYLEKYHEYLRQLVDEYVKGGRFDETYQRIREQIDSLVETDPNAFYTYDEYEDAAQMLYETIQLRAESIDGQLRGTIPSTDEGQREDSSSLIDASSIDIETMGQFEMGQNFEGGFGRMLGGFNRQGAPSPGSETASGEESEAATEMDNEATTPENETEKGAPSEEQTTEEAVSESMAEKTAPAGMPAGFGPGSMSGQSSDQTKKNNLIIFGGCLAVMLAALFILRRRRR